MGHDILGVVKETVDIVVACFVFWRQGCSATRTHFQQGEGGGGAHARVTHTHFQQGGGGGAVAGQPWFFDHYEGADLNPKT